MRLGEGLLERPGRPLYGARTRHPAEVARHDQHARGADVSGEANGEAQVFDPCLPRVFIRLGEGASANDTNGLQPGPGQALGQVLDDRRPQLGRRQLVVGGPFRATLLSQISMPW